MDIKKISFSDQELRSEANKYFVSAGGFDASKEKHRRMLEAAAKVREISIDGITVNAHLSIFGPEVYKGNKIVVDDIEVTGNCFDQIDQKNILKVYIYIITVGEIDYEKHESIVDQLHAHMWGTAYVDAGRDYLEEYIKNDVKNNYPGELNKTVFLSQDLSPGFYGIPTPESIGINKITKGYELGIDVKETGVMIPVKTCSGVFVLVNDKKGLPAEGCISCITAGKGCTFCKKNKSTELNND